MHDIIQRRNFCAICSNKAIETIIELGNSPVTNKFLNDVDDTYGLFPLNLQFCKKCNNLQLEHCINDDFLYDDSYAYFTPVSKSLK